MEKAFLPISKKDMKERGWDQCDFVFVIGDAYVDHSSFGPAIMRRMATKWGLSRSRTGKTTRVLPCLASPDSLFWCVQEIWIPW